MCEACYTLPRGDGHKTATILLAFINDCPAGVPVLKVVTVTHCGLPNNYTICGDYAQVPEPPRLCPDTHGPGQADAQPRRVVTELGPVARLSRRDASPVLHYNLTPTLSINGEGGKECRAIP